ncbi:MAG: S-layer homology domain-containing protein [Clostridiaceae bacterium]|nr:S-layer homology domain-containing protein [Clostridiaceae bacterium]
MKHKKILKTVLWIMLLCVFFSNSIYSHAYPGSMGYEGGVSAADPYEDGTYAYREVCFLSGVPVIMEGTLKVKKSARQGKTTTTYRYDLSNIEQDASITRVIVMDNHTDEKERGQTVEKSVITKVPVEVVRINGVIYNLRKYDFTRSGITDPQPAVNYNTGEYTIKKTYNISTGGTVSVEMKGRQYGYDQYWSSAKAASVDLSIKYEPVLDGEAYAWDGFARVSVSNVAKKSFKYVENEPWQISFEGGYVEQDWEESILEYNAYLPEFDKSGFATDVIREINERIGLNTEPVNSRLMVPDLKHLRGHWAEEPVKILYSLEVLPGTGENFNPAEYVTRRDFTAMLVKAIKDIPEDPDLVTRTTTARTPASRQKNVEESPFADINTDDQFYNEIKIASTRGIVQGTGQSYFRPDRHITMAEAITMIIRAIGLEGLAAYPYSITAFIDNDEIPAYARNPAEVAFRIGLVEGDSRGYLRPNDILTYERASALIYRLIRYMGEDLVKDYCDRFFD